MNFKELMYALALQEAKGVGAITAKKLISIYGSATQLFEAHQEKRIEKEVNLKLFQQLFSKASLAKAEKELNRAVSKGLKCLYYQDENYPKDLLNCADAPLILFQDGGGDFNQYQKVISIVGTRNMSNYGRGFCAELIAAVKEYQPLIVSGYAFGVDICAHLEALKNNLPTTAVLAHGFATVYPNEHKRFYQEMKESGGFLSEFIYDEPPLRNNFLKRNRIVAGISQATIVVESASKGGSLVTADIANSYHKDVFALPGRTTDVYSKGCNELIKNHKAALITSGEDLIAQLGWKKSTIKEPKIVQPQLFVDLEGGEKEIYDLLAVNAMHADELSRTSGIPIYKVSNFIFQLELKGLIQVLPGKLIKRI
ncbi:DNA processing protein DprA [Wenyingzhuangia fucanilytica]|uniref:DNA processing protein DprA n=1 Tax=Wenyingzhuangia fucanilytica TaxID=1790137 RepID=A0A1B1Y9B6_9FLAO|nr:DNA-processing protein DprA [Wenyingzhuangia fucanilytica]ANW97373.1 DNA processing protein DprA [Wenyingzhuangia fucanilytica]